MRPYSTGKTAEIVAAPKVYGFDTGFVFHLCGWHQPRRDDLGLFWEHYVLNAFAARYPNAELIVVAQDVERGYANRFDRLSITFTSLEKLIRRLEKKPA